MGATFNKNDINWLLACPKTKKLDALDETLMFTTFDTQTDWDIKYIETELQNMKKVKRLCRIKLITFIPEAIASFFFSTKEEHKLRRSYNRLYFKFLFNKITYDNFKKELITLTNSDKMVI